MKNFHLRNKVLVGYGIMILILISVTIYSVMNFMSLNKAIDEIMLENYNSIIAAENMMEAIERQDSAQLIYSFGQTEKGLEIFGNNEVKFLKYLSRAEDNITIEDEKGIINNINKKYRLYLKKHLGLKDLENEKKMQSYYLNESNPLFKELKEKIRELLIINQEHMKKSQQNANANSKQATISTVIFSMIAIIIAIILGLKVSKLILTPIKELTQVTKKIASGDLNQEIKVNTKDEIGELAEEFNKMTDRLKEYEEMNVNTLIAEKNKSEAIVRSISNPLIVTDSENRVLIMNSKAEEIFGLKEKLAKGNHFLETIKNEEIFNLIDETLKTDNIEDGIKSEELKLHEDKDKEAFFRVTTNPVTNKKKEVKMVVTLFDDITHLKETDNLKTEFVSIVSHEFRTPLTSMKMGINMLLEREVGELNETQEELLEVAEEDCERLNNLVDDLLDLSKIESGEIDLEFENVKINEILKIATKPFIEQAKNKGVEIIAKEGQKDLKVHVDINKVTWIITNLIGNALRYTSEGDKIKIIAEKKGHKAHISVEDTGKGIPHQYQGKIFDKFVRVGEDKDSDTGSGLGLAISKEMVEAHGGRIWVESEEGKGTTFTFTVKLAK
ncbi:MAG: ATP-binding protein [Fusobacteriota bacterium]